MGPCGTGASPPERLVRGGRFCVGGVAAKHAGEDGVDGAQLAMQIEGVSESFFVEEFADVLVGCDAVAETRVRFPGGHGVPLDPFVCVLAWRPALDQVLQQLTRKDEPLRRIEVPQHPLWKYI